MSTYVELRVSFVSDSGSPHQSEEQETVRALLGFSSRSSTSCTVPGSCKRHHCQSLFLEVLKCSGQEQSHFSLGFGLRLGYVCSSYESEAVANTVCCSSIGYIPSLFLSVRWRIAVQLVLLMDKESLVLCHADVSFPLVTGMSPKWLVRTHWN